MLLGSQYGEQSISGASYFALEYEYALSRAKPIVVFMHEQPESREMHLQEAHPQLKEKFLAFRKNYYMKLTTYFTLKALVT